MGLKANRLIISVFVIGVLVIMGCQKKEEAPEITQEELTAAVPELDSLHQVIHPLWHRAYPQKDYDLVKQLLPQLDSSAKNVYQAELPGILRDKQEDWDKGIEKLKTSVSNLHQAVEKENKKEILQKVEAVHAGYARLMRTIIPLVPELDAFHQELYKVYHYYMPNYKLEKIRLTVTNMQDKLSDLKQAQLPDYLSDRKDQFDEAVQKLDKKVSKLAETVQKDDKEAIKAALEEAHNAYLEAEAVFE